MSVLKYKHFTRPEMLHRIGRGLLLRFLEKFECELLEHNLAVPPPSLHDPEWLAALAQLLSTPEGLPGALAEALYAIDEMSANSCQDDLERAINQAQPAPEAFDGCTREDLAMHLWLANPTLLARLHNQQRLRRLSAFEYFGASPAGQNHGAPTTSFAAPDASTVARLEKLLDGWFALHQRGRNTCRVEVYPIREREDSTLQKETGSHSRPQVLEYWFLIRHGDTFARAPKVEERRTEIIHFRPQRDDVVVYAPATDEIRINCRTRGECELYVRSFGEILHGNQAHFGVQNTYTLEPLRSDGPDALHTEDVPELDKMVLRQLKLASQSGRYVVTHSGEDLFSPVAQSVAGPIPHFARLRCATFDLHFRGCGRPRPLHIRPPNFLKLGRHCDVQVVHRLLRRRGFRR